MTIDYVDIETVRAHQTSNEWTPKHGAHMLAASYGRVSDVSAAGTEVDNARSNAEQHRAFDKVCAANGWVAKWFVDEGAASGSRNRHKRTAFDDIKALIGTGKVDVFHVWSSSRSARDVEVVYNELLPVLKATNTRYSYGRRVYNPNDPNDRDAIIQDAQRDEAYSRRIGEDVSRAAVERADAGYPHGRPPFGYRRVWVDGPEGKVPNNVCRDEAGELLPDAIVVQWMFASILNGTTMASMVSTLEATRPLAARTTKHGKHKGRTYGGAWSMALVRSILTNPAYAGLRTYSPSIQGQKRTAHVVGPAMWEALVSLADYETVRATFAARAMSNTRHNTRKSLLAGVARCGVCQAPLQTNKVTNGAGERTRVYACPSNARHIGINTARTDDIVTMAFVDGLPSLSRINPTNSPDALRIEDAIAERVRNLETWKAKMMAGRMDEDTAADWSRDARAEIAKLKAEREALDNRLPWPSTVDELINADDPLTKFAALTLDQRAAVLRAVVTVTINKATRKGVFDATRIVVKGINE